MRHHNSVRKFGRVAGQRKAFMRSLANNLILNDKIKTTEIRAKEVRPMVEKLVTLGKKNTLAVRRLIASKLGPNGETKKVVDELAPKYKARRGGYTRIVKMGKRVGDGAPMALIEFV